MDRARMKTLFGHGLTALLVCCVILGLLMVLSNVFHPKNNRYEDGMIDSPANGAVGERQDTIDVLFVEDVHRFFAVLGRKDRIAFLFENDLFELAGGRIVFRDEDVEHTRTSFGSLVSVYHKT